MENELNDQSVAGADAAQRTCESIMKSMYVATCPRIVRSNHALMTRALVQTLKLHATWRAHTKF